MANSGRMHARFAATLASVPFFLPVSVPAAALAADSGPEEIVVTARKRSESVVDVPAAVTALSQDDLQRVAANALEDITGRVPNLTIFAGSAQSNAASIFIRGIGQRDSLQTFESGVGLYVDGVYMSRMQGSMMRLFDIERLEVLRGPQGTLYGKNTIGGAVNVVTRDPFDGGGFAEVSYGSYDEVIGSLYAAVPLSDDTVAVSVAARYANRDGFYTDPATGVDYQDDNSFSGRLKLAFRPSETVSVTLAADILDIDVNQYVGRAEDSLFVLDVASGPVPVRDQPGPFDGTVRTSIDPENGQTNTHWGLSGTLDWDLSDTLALKSITAYRHMNPVQWLDADGSELEIADVWATWVHEQWSQEVQLTITQDRWDMVFGAFYMTEESVAVQETFLNDYILLNGVPLGFSQPGNDVQNVESIALFGHADVKLTDRLSLSLGARWSRDDKDFVRTSETFTGGVLTGTVSFDEENDWSAFTPSATLDYKLSEDSHIYASASRGFRSGGYNGRVSGPDEQLEFDPEFVWSYEAGWKGRAADGRLTYGLAAFYNDYSDYQARIAVAVDPSDLSAGFNFPTVNAASLEIYGLEAEVSYEVGPWSLWGNLGLLDASYSDFTDATGDRTDEDPIRSPDVTLNVGASHLLDLDGRGTLRLTADLNYVSSYYTSVDNSDVLFEDGYVLGGAHAAWQDEAARWSVRAGVRNLFDTAYQVDAFEFRTLGNAQTAFYAAPRTWYLAIGRMF